MFRNRGAYKEAAKTNAPINAATAIANDIRQMARHIDRYQCRQPRRPDSFLGFQSLPLERHIQLPVYEAALPIAPAYHRHLSA
jgi:hypothetical protein